MSTMESKELIEQQIQKGTEILEQISTMRERPTMVINVVAYLDEDVQKNRKSIDVWQYLTIDILTSIFGENGSYVTDFRATVTEKKTGFNYQREFRDEVNKGLAILEAIRGSFELGISHNHKETTNIAKSTKIFISHKTEDKPFVEELVKLIESIIGIDSSKIFCSSIGGYDIKPGKEILSELKRQFDEYNILFIVVHSPRYYKSPVCLNEMGAAWVLGSNFFSFLTPDCKYNMLNGVIDGRYMSIKVNDSMDTVVSKLNSFKEYLLDTFSIDRDKFNLTRWEMKRNEFIDKTTAIQFEKELSENSAKDSLGAKANISAELISKNPYVVSITNRGESDAKNLNLKLDEKCEGMLISGLDHFPIEYLKPGRHVNLSLYPCIGDPDQFKIFFSWEEKGNKYNSEEIIIL